MAGQFYLISKLFDDAYLQNSIKKLSLLHSDYWKRFKFQVNSKMLGDDMSNWNYLKYRISKRVNSFVLTVGSLVYKEEPTNPEKNLAEYLRRRNS